MKLFTVAAPPNYMRLKALFQSLLHCKAINSNNFDPQLQVFAVF